MLDTVREAPFGQLVRYVTGNKYFRYPEEMPGFEVPRGYGTGDTTPVPEREKEEDSDSSLPRDLAQAHLPHAPDVQEKLEADADTDLEQQTTLPSIIRHPTLTLQRTQSLPWTEERLQIERTLDAERTVSKPIAPSKTVDGIILVDWYTTDDPANPQNWVASKKAGVAALIWSVRTHTLFLQCGQSD